MNNKEPDLKKELKKKKRHFRETKEKSKRKLKKGEKKISREEEEKIVKESRHLETHLHDLDEKHEDALKKLDKRHKKLDRDHVKKEEEAHHDTEKKHKEIHKDAEKDKRQLREITDKEIRKEYRDLVRLKARVYSRRRKIFNALQFIAVIYIFILSIVIIKDVALALSSSSVDAISGTISSPLSAFGGGWLAAILAQSASVIAILANTLAGSGIINFDIAFYILLGLTLGNAVTPIFASLVIKTEHHWDLRHGFELGLANVIYSFFLVSIVFLIQFFTHFFTNTGYAVEAASENIPAIASIPSLLDVVTVPVISFFHINEFSLPLAFVIGIALLVFSLSRVGKSMFVFMGGRRHTRAIIEKYMSTYWKSFLIGLGLTIVIPSSSLLVTLMVPLAITRIVTLRQAIPYLIGTNVGTFIDVLLASFANAQGFAIAGGVVLTLLSMVGVLFIFRNFGVMLIYRITRYISLHVITMRKRNIVKFLVFFVVIPALIVAVGQVLPI